MDQKRANTAPLSGLTDHADGFVAGEAADPDSLCGTWLPIREREEGPGMEAYLQALKINWFMRRAFFLVIHSDNFELTFELEDDGKVLVQKQGKPGGGANSLRAEKFALVRTAFKRRC